MFNELNKLGVYMDNNTQSFPSLSLETKTLVASLAVESFLFRSRSHVNVVTNAVEGSISLFVYVDGKAEKSYLILLGDKDATEKLTLALAEVRRFKRTGTFNLNLKLAS
jgi:hypothetical protein